MSSRKGILFVISAPAGTGKTTLVAMLKAEFPQVVTSISYTTRQPRLGEVHGVDYYFVTREEFEKRIQNQEFLEYVHLYGEYYGTSKTWVEEHLKEGKHLILTIDTQGALQLKNLVKAVYIFIKPPSLDALKERMERRRTETPEEMTKRLKLAEQEIQTADRYDYNIVNDSLEAAYDVLRSIVIAEQHRIDTEKK